MRALAVIDLETDPFKYGRVPMPFAAGFYNGQTFIKFWGDDCVKQLLDYLDRYPDKLIIYAHNGGKFDYWFMAHAISEPLSFIDSRLVKARLGKHELRDSYKIFPMPLSAYQKDEIDYAKFERDKREHYKSEIIDYLRSDCVYLFDLIAQFREQFGNVLTIGGAAMREIKARYDIEHLTPTQDAELRHYFHGGRCEAFEIGELKNDWKLYDVNSLYPHVMAEFEHAQGTITHISKELPDDAPFYLAHVIADSRGALPVRSRDGLTFPHGRIESYCTSHEIIAALELGLISNIETIRVLIFDQTRNFRNFVYHFNNEKINAEKSGDKTMRLFSKLIMNNAYGKFAQNPERFKEFFLFESLEALENKGCELAGEIGDRFIGTLPARIRKDSYYNVATAASITGAARSILMRALASAENAIYCDTDSIVCTKLNAPVDQFKLGQWKLEQTFDTFYCAGKKLYAAYANGKPVKQASKGVATPADSIRAIARGEAQIVPIEAPSLRIGKPAHFISRTLARAKKRC